VEDAMPQGGKSKLDRLRDAGCIPADAAFDANDEAWIEQSLSDEDVDAIIEIKSKLGSGFFIQNGTELRHFIFF
jgi:hypothetical protein